MINQKKKIAFILGGMSSGGPSRSFLNVSSLIDYNKYDVNLILFSNGGVLIDEVPSEITIELVKPRGLFCSFSENKVQFILWFPIRLLLFVLRKYFLWLFKGDKARLWGVKKIFIHKDKCFYDLAISYVEGAPAYYLSESIKAKVKIARVPVDYNSIKSRATYDIRYFKKMNYLFTITEGTADILKDNFPSLKNRIKTFELITPRKLINNLAANGDGFRDDFNGIRILTLANAHVNKGVILALKACKILVNLNVPVIWYWMGGRDKTNFIEHLEKMDLLNYFFFMSPQVNPFPFLKQADIFVLPSYYEGKSNAINEAKAICKPIVITKFPTSYEIIEHNTNGLISDLNPESLASSIKLLVENQKLRARFSDYWEKNFDGNESEMNKLLDLL
jgi:glycosyltransferase involved in cell wall biosynthesis